MGGKPPNDAEPSASGDVIVRWRQNWRHKPQTRRFRFFNCNRLKELSPLGIVAPWVSGLIVQINGSSRLAFVITGGVALAGAFFWGLLVQRVEPVHWDAPNCMAGIT